MKKNKFDILFIILMLLSILGTVFVYAKLPDQVPTHWNIKGMVDDYSSKSFVYFTGLLPVVLYAIMRFMPKIDPKKESYDKHGKAYKIIIFLIILFIIWMHWMTIGYSLGYPLDIIKYVKISLGLLFIGIGNYMPQIRFNYFLGIRTPWTLSSENVWKKTHMIGGYLYFLMGVIFIMSSFFKSYISFYVSMGSIVLISLGVTLYSYLLYKKEIKKLNL